jgi:hypothetical protein
VNRASWVSGRTTRSVMACMLDGTVSHIHNRAGECADGEVGGAKDGDELGCSSSPSRAEHAAWRQAHWLHPRDLAKDLRVRSFLTRLLPPIHSTSANDRQADLWALPSTNSAIDSYLPTGPMLVKFRFR